MTAKDDMRKLIDNFAAETDKLSKFTSSGKQILNEEWPNDFANKITITREEWLEINRALSGAVLGLQNIGHKAGSSPQEQRSYKNELIKQVKAAQAIMGEVHDRSNPT